jgi:hypothetical protein
MHCGDDVAPLLAGSSALDGAAGIELTRSKFCQGSMFKLKLPRQK